MNDAASAPVRLRVAAFTAGRLVSTARMRVRQYIGPLARLGIAIDERWPSLGAFPPRRQTLRPAWLAGTLMQRLPHIAAGWSGHHAVAA